MLRKPEGCIGCALERKGQGFVPCSGMTNLASKRLLIQGEAPGRDEVDEGMPFVGKSGNWLWKAILETAGVTRDECIVDNSLRCLPPATSSGEFYPIGKVRSEAERQCRQYDVWAACPKHLPLLLLGGKATALRFGQESIQKWNGHIADCGGRIAGCTFHPAAVLRQPNLLPVVVSTVTNLLSAASDPSVLKRPTVNKWDDIEAFTAPTVLDLEWDKSRSITVAGTARSGDLAYSTENSAIVLERAKTSNCTIIGHNLIDADFDVMNWFPTSFKPERVFDTKVVGHIVHAHLAELGLLSLGSLTRMYHPTSNWKEDKDDQLTYNGYDCAYNYRLFRDLESDITATNQRHLIEKQQRLAYLAVLMRRDGVKVDSDKISSFEKEWTANRQRLKEQFPFNPNSPKQIIKWASEAGASLRDTTAETIGAAARRYSGELGATLAKLAEYKDEGKPISTWFNDAARDSGFIHPTHNVTGTSVARFSSNEPNCQNIPPYLRHIIIPRSPELELVSFDFSNIENRTAAWIAGDMEALELWAQGHDPYIATAALMFDCTYSQVSQDQRAQAKTTELATLYGETEYNLAKRLFGNQQKPNVIAARNLQDNYFRARPMIKKWQRNITRQMDSGDITLHNPFGRVRYIYAQDSHNRMKRACHFLGCSTAADHVNQQALNVWDHVGIKPILIVHDELCYELPKGDVIIRSRIAEVLNEPVKELGGLLLPWKRKVGADYGSMYKSG